jgi:Icc-related predicted phosphoesterase
VQGAGQENEILNFEKFLEARERTEDLWGLQNVAKIESSKKCHCQAVVGNSDIFLETQSL